MKYLKKELVKLFWNDFDGYALKIKREIEDYLNRKDLKIDIIVPILRGGGMLALKLAMLNYTKFRYNNQEDF